MYSVSTIRHVQWIHWLSGAFSASLCLLKKSIGHLVNVSVLPPCCDLLGPCQLY